MKTAPKFYAGERVNENQPDDMRFVIAFKNLNARKNWIRLDENFVALPYDHPEVKLAKKTRHMTVSKIPGAAWIRLSGM